MDRASTRMQGLIEDLLEASRVEAGSLELTRRVEQGAAIVRAAIAKARPAVADKGAALEEGAITEDLPVELDRARTVDALVKLVAVALKTIGEGGVIRIGVEPAESSVIFTIRASRPRSSSGTTPHDESRGGLAFLIARGLVAAQGGQLSTELTQEGPRTLVTFKRRA
jgi:K+-sensing histidine kinase KdpD